MTYEHRNDAAPDHKEMSALVPWYVNDSIGERERQRLEAHLLQCANCREDLTRERWIYQGMRAETAIEYMPATSLKRLQARLDGVEAGSAGVPAEVSGDVTGAGEAVRRPMRWPGLMAASVAVMAVALSLLAADRWMQFRAHASAPSYYTVTTSAPRPANEAIRAVFSPTVTLIELQAMLDEAQLRIISGPSEAGVYSLATTSRRPVSSSLALLRAHAKVRFAESTGPDDTR